MDKSENGKEWGRGGGSTPVYIVEARLNYHEPKQYHGMLLDSRWRRVHFPEGPVGVPVDLWKLQPETRNHGFLDYQAAMALAYWFMAGDGKGGIFGVMSGLCVETRLVKIQYKYSYETTEIGVGETMSVNEESRRAKFTQRDGEPVNEGPPYV